jgi:MFS family permease
MPLQFRLSVLLFLQFFVWSSWLINLGTYMLQSLDFSGRQVGMIYATNAIAATITPPLMGWLADRLFSADRLMVLLNILGGVALIGCFFTTSFLPFYTLMLVYNLCFIPTFSLAASLCFHHLPRPDRQYPGIRVWGTVSFMLMGLFLSYFDVENSPYPLLAGGMASVLLGFYCLTLPHTPPAPGFNWATVKGENVQKIFRERGNGRFTPGHAGQLRAFLFLLQFSQSLPE